MKKTLIGIVAIAFVIIAASAAFATESRLESLGGQEIYMVDDENVFRNPANATAYGDTVQIGIDYQGSGGTDGWGGGIVTIGDAFYLGLFVARDPAKGEEDIIGDIVQNIIDTSTAYWIDQDGDTIMDDMYVDWSFQSDHLIDGPVSSISPDLGAVDWVNPFDIILAGKFGDISAGLKIYYANGKATEDDLFDYDLDGLRDEYNAEMTSSLLSIDLGISADMGDITPEVWVDITPFSVESDADFDWGDPTIIDNNVNQEISGTRIGFGIRALYKMSDAVTLVPQIQYARVTGDYEVSQRIDPVDPDNINNDDFEFTSQKLSVGMGVNYRADKVLIIGSLGVDWDKTLYERDENDILYSDSDEFEESYFAIPVAGLGIEYDAAEFATLRAGLHTTTAYARDAKTHDVDYGDPLAVDEENDGLKRVQSTTATAGVGWHFGNLDVDTTVGGKVIAGELSDSFVSRVNFLYSF